MAQLFLACSDKFLAVSSTTFVWYWRKESLIDGVDPTTIMNSIHFEFNREI